MIFLHLLLNIANFWIWCHRSTIQFIVEGQHFD